LEKVIKSLRGNFTKEGILKARAIEGRLMHETWLSNEYNLLPKLAELSIPTLVIHGDYDIIPVKCAEHIAQTIPAARFALLKDCGHFSFIVSSGEVHKSIREFVFPTDCIFEISDP
jgi:proline iminopeptidase